MVGLPCYIYIENIVAARLYSVFFPDNSDIPATPWT